VQAAVEGMDHITAGVRLDRVIRGSLHPERVEDAFADEFTPGRAGDPFEDRAEQAVGQVGVSIAAVRRTGHLVVRQVGQQFVHIAAGVAFPPRPVRFALQPGDVPEQLAQGDTTDRGARQMPVEQVVEGEETLVTQLHHQRRGDRLGDRAEPVLGLRVRPWLLAGTGEVQDRTVADEGESE
jgi:hypothetical protein